jgi:hypothetical protein
VKTTGVVFGLLFLLLVATRLCHVDILWAEEDLPLAAAAQMLQGKALYRDFWFDKPPLTAAVYLLWGAEIGWVLRLAGALYVLAACALIERFARQMWSAREGLLAACCLAFFLTFGIPSAVIPLAADLLMLLPHLAAVYLAWRGRAFWSGVMAGTALLFQPKGLFVVAVCALWLYRSLPPLAIGFLVPNLVAVIWFGAQGALHAYYQQVWQWGAIYAANTFLENPVRHGLLKTVNWMGFQAALVLGAMWFWWRDPASDRRRLALWAALSLISVTAGWRFFPRYYFQLLPVMTLAAARGFSLLNRKRALVLVVLLIPFLRFGPRYVLLAKDLLTGEPHQWRDVAMNQDSRAAAQRLHKLAGPGDTMFVWGFRPDIYAYARLPLGTRFLESQPLTGVFADRHLVQAAPLAPDWTKANRKELMRSAPTFVLDGLGPYNPALSIEAYPDLEGWFSNYEVAARTRFTVIYRLQRSPQPTSHNLQPVTNNPETTSPPSTARASPGTRRSLPARQRPASSSS